MQSTCRSSPSVAQPLPHRFRGVAADARVDLVEDVGRGAAGSALAGQREHQPRELAARRRIAEWRHRHPRIGRDAEGDPLLSQRSESPSLRLQRDLELRAAHSQLIELLRHALLQSARGLGAHLAQPTGEIGASPHGVRELGLQPLGRLAGALDRVDLRAAVLGVSEHRLDRAAVLPLQPVDHVESLLDLLEPARLGLDAFGVAAQLARQLLQVDAQPCGALSRAGRAPDRRPPWRRVPPRRIPSPRRLPLLHRRP